MYPMVYIYQDYIERVRPGGSGLGSDTHKILYNHKLLSDNFKESRIPN